MATQQPGPADDADLVRLAKEASWLLSAFDQAWLDLPTSGLFLDWQGDIATRGEYQRWMQDTQGWALRALRSCERPAGLYRDQVRVDQPLRDAGQAVARHVATGAPQGVHDALTHYVAETSLPTR